MFQIKMGTIQYDTNSSDKSVTDLFLRRKSMFSLKQLSAKQLNCHSDSTDKVFKKKF